MLCVVGCVMPKAPFLPYLSLGRFKVAKLGEGKSPKRGTVFFPVNTGGEKLVYSKPAAKVNDFFTQQKWSQQENLK